MDSRELAWKIRRHGIEMTHLSGGSHIGAIMSVADIIAVLYSDVMSFDSQNPKWDKRDRFILSKGHAGAAIYAALAENGFFDVNELKTHYQNGSRLSGHVSHHLPGVDFSTGSLGHGLSAGVGMAYEVYVYCSDENITKYIPQGVIFLKRDKVLDGNIVKGFQIYEKFISEVEADIYVLAHATSPLIKNTSIENALQHVINNENDSAFSAEKIQTFAWYNNEPINYRLNDVPRTQDLKPIWIETSGFFIFKKEIFTKYRRRIGFNPYIQEVEGLEAIDIDERKDYELALKLLKKDLK